MQKTVSDEFPRQGWKLKSPMQALGIFVLFTFTAELVIMFLLDHVSISEPLSNIVDAALLTVLVLPALFFLVYRPLAAEALYHQQLKNEQQTAHDIMQTVLDSLDAIVYVADLKTHELLFLNKHARGFFGDNGGKVSWKAMEKNQSAPCGSCTGDKLDPDDGEIPGMHAREFRNTGNGHWYEIRDRAITWIDGRLVRLEIATDITDRKFAEEEREKLISSLEQAIEEVETLQGIVPICSHCKKIRDDEGFWKQVDEYVSKRTGARFSHSICPNCMQDNFPEYDK